MLPSVANDFLVQFPVFDAVTGAEDYENFYLQTASGQFFATTTNVSASVVSYEAPNGAVPEPATWAMMLLGFGGIGFTMRRRKPILQIA